MTHRNHGFSNCAQRMDRLPTIFSCMLTMCAPPGSLSSVVGNVHAPLPVLLIIWVFKMPLGSGKGLPQNLGHCSAFNHLGIQDAPRKRQGPSIEPGPLVGSTILSSGETVHITVTIDHWLKAQKMIQWIQDCVLEGRPLCFSKLQRVTAGFWFILVGRTLAWYLT